MPIPNNNFDLNVSNNGSELEESGSLIDAITSINGYSESTDAAAQIEEKAYSLSDVVIVSDTIDLTGNFNNTASLVQGDTFVGIYVIDINNTALAHTIDGALGGEDKTYEPGIILGGTDVAREDAGMTLLADGAIHLQGSIICSEGDNILLGKYGIDSYARLHTDISDIGTLHNINEYKPIPFDETVIPTVVINPSESKFESIESNIRTLNNTAIGQDEVETKTHESIEISDRNVSDIYANNIDFGINNLLMQGTTVGTSITHNDAQSTTYANQAFAAGNSLGVSVQTWRMQNENTNTSNLNATTVLLSTASNTDISESHSFVVQGNINDDVSSSDKDYQASQVSTVFIPQGPEVKDEQCVFTGRMPAIDEHGFRQLQGTIGTLDAYRQQNANTFFPSESRHQQQTFLNEPELNEHQNRTQFIYSEKNNAK